MLSLTVTFWNKKIVLSSCLEPQIWNTFRFQKQQ
jgi:hypothetical protein